MTQQFKELAKLVAEAEVQSYINFLRVLESNYNQNISHTLELIAEKVTACLPNESYRAITEKTDSLFRNIYDNVVELKSVKLYYVNTALYQLWTIFDCKCSEVLNDKKIIQQGTKEEGNRINVVSLYDIPLGYKVILDVIENTKNITYLNAQEFISKALEAHQTAFLEYKDKIIAQAERLAVFETRPVKAEDIYVFKV